MNHIEQLLALLPQMEAALNGGTLGALEGTIGQLVSIYNEFKQAKVKELGNAIVAPVAVPVAQAAPAAE
jgi:hypothetical protein